MGERGGERARWRESDGERAMERENEEGALDAEAQGTRRQPTRALCHCSRCIYKRARKERRKEEAVNGGGASLFVLFEKGERTPGPPAPPRPPPALSHGGDSSSSSGSATAEVTVQSSTGRDRTTNTAGRAEGPGRPRPCPSFLCPSCRPCARCSPPAPSQQAGGRRFPAAAFPPLPPHLRRASPLAPSGQSLCL